LWSGRVRSVPVEIPQVSRIAPRASSLSGHFFRFFHALNLRGS